MIGFSGLWSKVFSSSDRTQTADSTPDDQDEQHTETLELNVTVEEMTISPNENDD